MESCNVGYALSNIRSSYGLAQGQPSEETIWMILLSHISHMAKKLSQ